MGDAPARAFYHAYGRAASRASRRHTSTTHRLIHSPHHSFHVRDDDNEHPRGDDAIDRIDELETRDERRGDGEADARARERVVRGRARRRDRARDDDGARDDDQVSRGVLGCVRMGDAMRLCVRCDAWWRVDGARTTGIVGLMTLTM